MSNFAMLNNFDLRWLVGDSIIKAAHGKVDGNLDDLREGTRTARLAIEELVRRDAFELDGASPAQHVASRIRYHVERTVR